MSPSIKATLDSTIQEDDEDDSIFLNRNETKKASHDFVNKEIKRQQRILKKLIEENAAQNINFFFFNVLIYMYF